MSIPLITPGGSPGAGSQARTTAKGRQNVVYLVSKTHGAAVLSGSTASNHQLVPAPILQNVNITPKMSAETIQQFGNLNAALTVPDYTDCEVSFDIMETDLFQVYAAIMDLPPNTVAFTVMPDMLLTAEVTLFGNQYDQATGGIFESFVVGGVSISTMSATQDPGKSAKISFKGTGTIVRKTLGMAVDYSRFTGLTPSYVTPYDVILTGGTAGTLNNTAATNMLPPNVPNFASGTYNNYNLVLKNGQPTTYGFTVSGTSVTISTSGSPSDVWEFFIPVSGVAIGNIN